MEVINTHLDAVVRDYIDRYCDANAAARTLRAALVATGIGLRPVIDHLSIRTLDVQERALEFEALGFQFDDVVGVMERDSWWAKVFRKPGFPPIYIDQPFRDHRGQDSPLERWVQRFGDGGLHHIGIAVDDIEDAVGRMIALGIHFSGEITGLTGTPYRQIYTAPEVVDGEPHTTLELVERHWGFIGFWSPQSPLPQS